MSILVEIETLREILRSIPKGQVKAPNMPVSTYIQEAVNLYYWASSDREELQRVGLDWQLVDSLLLRADALKQAQSEWTLERYELHAAEQEWEHVQPQARNLQRELLHCFRFAYRGQPHRIKMLKRIAKGQSHADLVQDLCELAVVGKAHPEVLVPIGMQLEKLDEAEELSVRLGALLAAVVAARSTLSESKKQRDRAYTYLKRAVDEVRAYGRFVFRGQKTKQLHYGSKYFRDIRAGLRQKALKGQ